MSKITITSDDDLRITNATYDGYTKLLSSVSINGFLFMPATKAVLVADKMAVLLKTFLSDDERNNHE